MTGSLLIKKLAGFFLIIVGFLIAAAGYEYGSHGALIGGLIVLAIGLLLLVWKIIRRNDPSSV